MKDIKNTRMVIVVLSVLLVSFVITVGTAIYRFNGMYSTYLNESQERFLEAVYNDLATGLQNAKAGAYALEISDEFRRIFLNGSRPDMQSFIDSFCAEFKISFVNVVDSEGNIILRSYLPDNYDHDSIYNQTGVQRALNGERFASYEHGTVVWASARATAPVWNGSEIIGAVVAAFRFDTDEWADDAKRRYGVDVSVFSENLGCIVTTILAKDGTRKTGEPMSQAAYEATYNRGEQFREKNNFSGTLYDSLYIPVKDSFYETFAVLCVSVPADRIFNETLSFSLICALAAFLSLGVTAFVLLSMAGGLVRSQNELKAALEEANRANNAKSDFLAKMSHEIRTPLNAIIGMNELVLREDISDTVRKNTLISKQSGHSLLAIINDILDFSKIESGKMELICSNYDVASLIFDIISMIRVRVTDKPILIDADVSTDFPAFMYGDEVRVRQILLNLMNNSAKYTNEGRIVLKANFEFDPETDKSGVAVFSISDTGIGIKEEDIGKLFGVFSQVDTVINRKVEGTGLGLAITKTLAQMMDGDISVSSEYGKGSVFTVRIRQQVNGYRPLENITEAFNRRFDSESKNKTVKFFAPDAAILAVDDVEANLFVVSGLLAPYQIKVDTVTDGMSAIEAVIKNDYDFVLMDHMMPEMDGVETTRKIRLLQAEKYKNIPIIALTANTITGMREMFLENGFNDFISKPIAIKELDRIMNKWVPKEKREDPEGEKTAPVSDKPLSTLDAVAKTDERKAKLLQIICRDAGKAVVTLRETAANGNTKLFSITAHGMKSAMANIGETEKSQQAAALEKAGNDGDWDFIAANTENFIEGLNALIADISRQLPQTPA